MEEATKTTAKDLATMREMIYGLIQSWGVDIHGQRQKDLSALLKRYHEHRVITVDAPAPSTVEHKITCPGCQGVTVKKGKFGKLYVKVLTKSENETKT